ncbi:MAG: NADH oxidase [Planctomycetaceae bacterium]|nr:NADH oxidase [Planctomycetaceae bacterium]
MSGVPDATDFNGPVRRILIVGGVAGGATAAARARRMDERAQIIVFEKDGYPSFANCGLPYYLGGEIEDRDKLLVAPAELLRQRLKLDVRVRHQVLSIDRSAKRVEVLDRDAGKTYDEPYDKLILATGAAPIVPPVPGGDADGVFTLRNLEDTDAIHTYLTQRQTGHAVVVGGGYIGLEMAEQLRHRGLDVTLVELAPQVLTLMDAEMVKPIEDELKQYGVAVRINTQIQSIDRSESGGIAAVKLSDGSTVDCDVLVFGIGVRPSTELAQEAGLDIGASGGVATNEFGQTGDADIYAVGDAAEYPYGPTGGRMRVPLAGPANRAGRIAGQHAASDAADAAAPVMGTAIARIFGLSAGLTGLSMRAAAKFGLGATAVTVIANNHAGYYPGATPILLKLVYDPGTGRILGAQAVGADGIDKRIDVIATAMRFGASVRDLAGVDLCYAPPFGSAKDPVHMAVFAACNQLDGLVKVKQPDADLTGLQVVDVRSTAEVERAPLAGTAGADVVHIPLDELRDRLDEIDLNRPTVTSCASGLRSYNAARVLIEHGASDVANLSGAATMRRHAVDKMADVRAGRVDA